MSEFEDSVARNVAAMAADDDFRRLTMDWHQASLRYNYTYNYRWAGRPIIQAPQDIVAVQEVIWATRPDLVIETGIAHGGSLVLSASILALLDLADAMSDSALDPRLPRRKVLGIDIDIRAHNRAAIEAHPMASRINMIQGSSIAAGVVAQVREIAAGFGRVMVCLDSNHTHDHVLAELQAYAPLVSEGCYCIVFDTGIEDMPDHLFDNRPWGKGNNPKTAVHQYLAGNPGFMIDRDIHNRLAITAAHDGYLRRIG